MIGWTVRLPEFLVNHYSVDIRDTLCQFLLPCVRLGVTDHYVNRRVLAVNTPPQILYIDSDDILVTELKNGSCADSCTINSYGLILILEENTVMIIRSFFPKQRRFGGFWQNVWEEGK